MSLKFDVDARQLESAIQAVHKESGRTGSEMLKYAMILMLTSGRNNTPLGRKIRPVQSTSFDDVAAMPESSTFQQVAAATHSIGKKFIRLYRQSAAPEKIWLPRVRRLRKQTPENEKAKQAYASIVAKFREIQFRGTAKKSWGWAMWKATGTNGGHGFRVRRRDPIEVTKDFGGLRPFLEVENKLGWIRKLVPNIEQTMMNSATHRLEAWLEKRWQSGIDKATRAVS